MKYENALIPNDKQMKEFTEGDIDTPIYMVNLLKFKNNNGQNFEQWKIYRKPRVTNKDKIEIKLTNIKITEINNCFEVSFIQEYKSGNIDSRTNKKLIIETVDNQIKIINEIC